jgi:methyl-accepting chemotaxis protein
MRKKLLIGVFGIAFALIVFSGSVSLKLYRINEKLTTLAGYSDRVDVAKDLQFRISNVWQFCTDASLTQDMSALTKDAADNYKLAIDDIVKLQDFYADRPEVLQQLNEVKTALDEQLTIGKEMIGQYAAGKAEGDAVMKKFDMQGDKIIRLTDDILKANHTASIEYRDALQHGVSSDVTLIILFSIMLIAGVTMYISYISRYISQFTEKMLTVIKHIERGVFAYRINDIHYDDDLGEISWALNNMLDQFEAFLKELVTSIHYSSIKKYFRKPISTGLHGAFIEAVAEVKASLDLQEKTTRDIEDQQTYLSASVNTMLGEMDKFADGDLTVHLEAGREDEIGTLYQGFNRSVEKIRSMITQVYEAVDATASASAEISSSTEEMAAGAQEQTRQAMEVTGAVEEMTQSIQTTTANVDRAASMSKKSGEQAKVGGKVVEETVAGMNRIADVVKQSAATVQALGASSDQIGEIAQVIDDIADQTNLLALNAAIEAARAGEQGRGFAVVADEVRKLAERTSKATKEISAMIQKIQTDTALAVDAMTRGNEEVENGKRLSSRAGESLNEIIMGTNEVVKVIGEIAEASAEEEKMSRSINSNIESINNVTRETATGTHEIAKAAEDLNQLTNSLHHLVTQFRLTDDETNVQKISAPAHQKHVKAIGRHR